MLTMCAFTVSFINKTMTLKSILVFDFSFKNSSLRFRVRVINGWNDYWNAKTKLRLKTPSRPCQQAPTWLCIHKGVFSKDERFEVVYIISIKLIKQWPLHCSCISSDTQIPCKNDSTWMKWKSYFIFTEKKPEMESSTIFVMCLSGLWLYSS